MKPFKAATNVSLWFLRISLVLFIGLQYIPGLSPIVLDSIPFYISVLFIVSAVALLIGGFLAKPNATTISGLIILALALFSIIREFNGEINKGMAIQIMVASIAFLFLCLGNKK